MVSNRHPISDFAGSFFPVFFAGSFFPVFLVWLFLIPNGFSADPINANKLTVNGKWKFNLSNSNMANMPPPQRATLVVSIHGNKLNWRETGIDKNGYRFDEIFDGPMDGRPRQLRGTHAHVMISFQHKNGAILGKWKGKGKRLSMAKLSQDGRSLTVENVSNVYNQVSNWTTSWDKAPE